jgi:hypothetical protein
MCENITYQLNFYYIFVNFQLQNAVFSYDLFTHIEQEAKREEKRIAIGGTTTRVAMPPMAISA